MARVKPSSLAHFTGSLHSHKAVRHSNFAHTVHGNLLDENEINCDQLIVHPGNTHYVLFHGHKAVHGIKEDAQPDCVPRPTW